MERKIIMKLFKSGKRGVALMLSLIMVAMLFAGCASAPAEPEEEYLDIVDEANTIDLADYIGEDFEKVALAGEAPISTTLMPVASGKTVLSNSKAEIDASNTADGYVMIRYKSSTDSKLKVIIECPSGVNYTYNLNGSTNFEVFPLSDGSGKYTIGIYKNVKDTSYSVEYKTSTEVKLKDEFAPFLLPNQYVNYTASSNVVAKAAELMAGKSTDLEKIEAVYNYVVKNFTYDKAKANSVQSGYLPDLDAVLAAKKGICFDYAAVMAAMLRSQGIPCKLVVGNAGTAYHAWINTYSQTDGWLDGVIYFDGAQWKLMDPTFASSGNQSSSVMQFIGDGSNYAPKYLY